MLQVDDRRSTLEKQDLAPWNAHLSTIERVIRTMREHLCEAFSLEDMADVACLSPYYFSRVFHQIIGTPPGEFLATLRLDMAKRLLLTTSMSVTDICFEVGYSALGSFTTRFTQQVGLPPRHLRHLARNVPPPIFMARRVPLPLQYTKGLSGRLLSVSPFSGLIFIGLFPKAIPQVAHCSRNLAPIISVLYPMDAISCSSLPCRCPTALTHTCCPRAMCWSAYRVRSSFTMAKCKEVSM